LARSKRINHFTDLEKIKYSNDIILLKPKVEKINNQIDKYQENYNQLLMQINILKSDIQVLNIRLEWIEKVILILHQQTMTIDEFGKVAHLYSLKLGAQEMLQEYCRYLDLEYFDCSEKI